MNNKGKLFLITLAVIFIITGCDMSIHNYYGNEDITQKTPYLLYPINNTLITTGYTTFSWNKMENAAFYVLQVSPSNYFATILIEENIAGTSIKIPVPKSSNFYYWRIKAYYRGGEYSNWSTTNQFMVGNSIGTIPPGGNTPTPSPTVTATPVPTTTPTPVPTAIENFSVTATLKSSNVNTPGSTNREIVEFNNRLWSIGGFSSTGITNGISYSEDGVNWTTLSDVPFPERFGHEAVVYQNKLWVIGGMSSNGKLLNDIWFSEDGKNWTKALDNATFSPRNGHKTIVYGNQLWLVGGGNTYDSRVTKYNDVWNTTNGIDWYPMGTDEKLTEVVNHEMFIFKNSMWLAGGLYNDKIWKTDMGVFWKTPDTDLQLPSDASTNSTFIVPSIKIIDNRIWLFYQSVIGSGAPSTTKVVYSEDGVKWHEPATTNLPSGTYTDIAELNGKLLIFVGNSVYEMTIE